MDWQVLKTELTTDPLTRGYSTMSDIQAANDLNTVYRDIDEGGIEGMVRYLATHKNRTNTGTDTVGSAMLGRLYHVADSAIGANPFGASPALTVTNAMKHAARSFIELFNNSTLSTVDFQNTEIDLFYTACTDAGVWKAADVTALKALSQSKQSRATELGIGYVREGDVAQARAM